MHGMGDSLNFKRFAFLFENYAIGLRGRIVNNHDMCFEK